MFTDTDMFTDMFKDMFTDVMLRSKNCLVPSVLLVVDVYLQTAFCLAPQTPPHLAWSHVMPHHC